MERDESEIRALEELTRRIRNTEARAERWRRRAKAAEGAIATKRNPKRCRRCGHRHVYREALCWSGRRGLFVCRCRNHKAGPGGGTTP
jgi:hypothetical protein